MATHSSLGNPRDGGALWAAVYGVTQSQTRLKWLSSSSSSNLYSRFLIFAFWYLLQFCTFKNPIFSTHFYLGVWLLVWLLSPLLTPFSLPGHLYLLPPPSLLYLTLWISLCILGCGEHLGNWSQARLVSFLLTPPPLLLVTSISFLPLLFSMEFHEPLWVF